MKSFILLIAIILTLQRESDRFILNLHSIDGLLFLNVQLGEDKIEKDILISSNSEISWIKSNTHFLNNIDKVK
jgi:hypothetical protein